MNFWGFPGNPPEFLKVLKDGFVEFFETEVSANPMKAEYLLPTIIGGMLRKGTCTVRALPTSDTWYGMTYQADVAAVKEAFAELLKAGVYKEDLFSDISIVNFKTDIFEGVQPPRNTNFNLIELKMPSNQDVYFMSKWHELFERYEMARIFLGKTQEDN